MSKIEAILGVYGTNLRKSIKISDEEITGWYIEDMTKQELQEKFTNEEIEYIYYNIVWFFRTKCSLHLNVLNTLKYK